MKIRASSADARCCLLRTAKFMRNVWMIDCIFVERSSQEAYFHVVGKDKGLSIYLAALRHTIWLMPESELRDEIGPCQPDMLMWIDTSCMIADCLTKRMRRCVVYST